MRSVFWRVLIVCILAGAPGIAHAEQTQVVHIKAHMFAYSPEEIVVKRGVPVTLELMSIDRVHGFNLPDFHVRATIEPWVSTTITFTPDKVGRFTFACDHFCGDGHDDMSGVLVVVD
ncbi:MAG TPA: cupredoxin domain-containing protein [Candidatus Angelobacter sp.]|nr:cupredoxin domain-containing protein [Candidatus Angelobacter sp.]